MSTEIIQHETLPPLQSEEPTGLIRLALEQKVDVAVLERLVALQERVTERNARGAFFEALSAFQEECPPIRKSKTADIVSKRTGSKFSYSYAPLEEIAHVIRPVLKKHGLSYTFDAELRDGNVLNVVCVLRHIEGHAERSSFPVPIESSERMSGAQSNGAALTYGRRQSLVAVLGLTTADQDHDAHKPESVDTISDSQAADLIALMDEVGISQGRFLKWAGVEEVANLPVSKLGPAIRLLEEKRNA